MAQQQIHTTRTTVATAGLASLFAVVAMLVGTTSAQAGSGSPASAKVVTVTYQGHGVSVRRASHQLNRLRNTSPEFQQAVSHRLDRLWRQRNGSKPACATAPVIIVKKWRSDGWAWIDDIGTFSPCPTGGNWEIWRVRDGAWRTILAGQDLPYCRQLRNRQVPEGMWNRCFTRNNVAVRYTGP